MRFAGSLLLIISGFNKSVLAFPSGAGSCGPGNTSVQGSHLANPKTGSLSDGGYTVSLGGAPLSSGKAANFAVGKDVELKIDGNTSFKGFLVRLGETGGVQTDKAFTVSGNDVQKSAACYDVGGVTHTNGSAKNSVSTTLNLAEPAANMPVDVTVVVSNSGGQSEYYYSQFLVTAGVADAPATDAPVVAATGAPVAAVTQAPVIAATLAPAATKKDSSPTGGSPVGSPAGAPVTATAKPVTAPVVSRTTVAPIATSQLAETKLPVASTSALISPPPPLPAVTSTGVDTCEDNMDFRYLATRNGATAEWGCFWLSKKPAQIQLDCVPGSAVMANCPETCGACVGTCKDDNTVMLDFKSLYGKTKAGSNCEWLRKHVKVWALNCVPGSQAFDACKDTCNNCGVIA